MVLDGSDEPCTGKSAISQGINRVRYPEIDPSDVMMASSSSGSSRSETVEEIQSPSRVIEDKIYVTVGKEEKENELNLRWALHNSGGRKICILHVHQPAQKTRIMGAKFSIAQMEEQEARAYHELERQDMLKLLDRYIHTCERSGVRAEKIYMEMDSIEKGIVELVSRHNIWKLAMGAAADKQYRRKMKELKSKKAIYVRLKAPDFCHIWFICKGHLIYTREGKAGGINEEFGRLSIQANPISETGQSNSLKSQSQMQQNYYSKPDYHRVLSSNLLKKISGLSPGAHYHTMVNGQERFVEWEKIPRRSPSEASQFSTCYSSEFIEDSASISMPRTSESDIGLELFSLQNSGNNHAHSSPPALQEGGTRDELYDRLLQFVAEADNSRQEAYEESFRRRKAEKEAIEAICRAKASETLYVEESRQRREIEEALERGKEEVEKMKLQLDEVKQEFHNALEQKAYLEGQIANADRTVQELEERMFSAVELLQKYKKERDDLQVERDNALRVAEELRKKLAEEASSRDVPRFFSEFSLSEIEEATRNFDPTLKIGEGGYGSIYRGLLRYTEVAIKMLNSRSLQGPSEFRQEVNVLGKLRHPNLVTLIGTCPEAFILIYEYLPNGSLEDRLCCRDNTPPLSWQTRIRIAAELCSVLIFLHSSSPHSIVHGDLKPANILLDANYVSKLGDFGICRVISQDECSSNNTTLCCRTEPKGTFAYIDPEFLSTGELTPKSDVYSFGIILLRLLTGKPALGITKEVQYALDKGDLKDILDSTAGDWPFVQAKQLSHLAMRCCDMNRRNRPDLASDIWRVVEPMRVCSGSSSLRLGSEEHCQIPPYFICPIFQEIMRDPVVAADGFTYEAEALKGWLDSGHDTSPMTNLHLAHCNLVPNHALRSAIQEWLQQP